MGEKDNMELSEEVYRVVKKPGTSLADSAETEGRKRALLQDENKKMKGPPELVRVEPEIRERIIERTRIVEKKPSFLGFLGREVVSQVAPELPAIAQELWQEHKAAKAREEHRIAQERQREIAALRRDAAEKELELERLRIQEREAEEKRQKEAMLSPEQKHIISLSSSLEVAYSEYQRDITKEEACKSLTRAFIYFIMGIKELQNVKGARIVDEETGELVYGAEVLNNIAWSELLQHVNMLLKANPSWLSKTQTLMLSETFGREFILNGSYIPLRANELQECLVSIT